MKDRGKAVAVTSSSTGNWFSASDHYSSSDLPCRKHPSTSSVGICAYCLRDRLIKLVCSDCGEQRLSSCSCSDISSSYPNSCVVEVGSVGRISFLIENDHRDQADQIPNLISSKPPLSEASSTTVPVLLKRSSSSSIEHVKRSCSSSSSSGFWRLGRFFRKKRSDNKGRSGLVQDDDDYADDHIDHKSEIWVSDHLMGTVSRSKSVCSFRGTTTSGFDDSSGVLTASVSTARASDFNNKEGHSETAAERKSGGFSITNVFKKEGQYCSSRISESNGFESMISKKCDVIDILDGCGIGDDSSGFIDLKLGFSSDSKPEYLFSSNRKSGSTDYIDSELQSGFRLSKDSEFSEVMLDSFEYPTRGGGGGGGGDVHHFGMHSCGGSCRITVKDDHKEMKKCKKSSKVWKWILRHQPAGSNGERTAFNKDHHHHHQENAFKSSPGRD